MAYSIISVRGKPKTYDRLARLQDYIEKRSAEDRTHGAGSPAWTAARDDLRLMLTPGNYDRWIAPVQAREEEDRLVLSVPDAFHRSWLEHKLDGRIRQAFERTGNGHLQTEYAVAEPTPARPDAPRILQSRDDWAAYTKARLDQDGITPRQGKQSDRYNSVLAIHYVLTASGEWFRAHPEQHEQWMQASVAFMTDLHGEAHILGAALHEHQTTPHLHVVAIPIDERGRLNAGAFTRTPEQLEMLHSTYNRHLRERGLHLERGQNVRLERYMATAPSEAQQRALRADDIPLDEVLERLEADRDGRDPRRWLIGDRLIQVHDDAHGFTEISPHGVDDGHGALDLVIRLRQEGQTPLEQHSLAVDYLAATHPERVTADGEPPPLVPHAPETRQQTLERQSLPFGQESRWEPGQFILVDSLPEALQVAGSAKGWGRVAVVDHPDALPVDELDEAIAKGWMVDVASKSEAIWNVVQERYDDLTEVQGRQVWRSPAPSMKAPATGNTPPLDHGPEISPDMMMGM